MRLRQAVTARNIYRCKVGPDAFTLSVWPLWRLLRHWRRILTCAALNRRPWPQTKLKKKNTQNIPTEEGEEDPFLWPPIWYGPTVCRDELKDAASPGFGNKSPHGFRKHGSNLELRRNPDYVFDTPNPADPRFKTHIPSSAVSASTSLTRADQGGC